VTGSQPSGVGMEWLHKINTNTETETTVE